MASILFTTWPELSNTLLHHITRNPTVYVNVKNQAMKDFLEKDSWREPYIGHDWHYIFQGILFGHRASKYTPTKYSPFSFCIIGNSPYQSTSNLIWVTLKKSSVKSLSRKRRLMLFYQLLKPWEEKCIRLLLKTFLICKQNNCMSKSVSA